MYKCSFSTSECGKFRDTVDCSSKLLECKDDISYHLQNCHLSKLVRKIEEYELILARAGMFYIPTKEQDEMWICPKHRYNLGRNWRPLKSCQYPLHSEPKKACKNKDVVNLEMSKKIQLQFGATVPVGSAICTSCLKKLKTEKATSHGEVAGGKNDESRLAKQLAAVRLESSTPCTPAAFQSLGSTKEQEWTPIQWFAQGSFQEDDQTEDPETTSFVPIYNEAMAALSKDVKLEQATSLDFQLKATWNEATESEKKVCVEKAIEGCKIVCSVIAPNAKDELLQACTHSINSESPSSELQALMQAYKKAPTKTLKTQILSLYVCKYPMKRLQELHEPYENITEWQMRKARRHAKEHGAGFTVSKVSSHRIRLPEALLSHFIDFVNRPYFHQDVAFGTRKLKLDDGEEITMPNVIRTVTRSTMVSQYLHFCGEQGVKPLSRATLFRILSVREASQQKSLSGVDDTAADGSSGFTKLLEIVDELHQLGKDKSWSTNMKKSLQDGKRYLKTQYRYHCQEDENKCSDHCRKFSLSDPTDPQLQEQCSHMHTVDCHQCNDMKVSLREIEESINSDSTNYYSKEQKEDLLYDFEKAISSIKEWKAHMRTANQERAKQDIMDALDSSSVLILMDWAMKFLQLRYREKQSEWYGKRGLSWHISSVVFRDEESGELRVTSYAHLFNKCTQDWYAVASIIEDLLQYLKTQNSLLCKAYLRSDEAGCYHNNNLIGAMKDIGKRVGVTIERYDYSEPHSGKDICDRIICPLKTSIRTYCCEGHDILTATDMRDALQQRPVKGTTASVNVVDESKQDLLMKKLPQFSSYHNFKFDDSGVKTWKAYAIGQGKSFPYSSMYVTQQGPTQLETKEDFFESAVRERDLNNKKSVSTEKENASPCLFECNLPGCTLIFDSYEKLEKHIDVGKHNQVAKSSVYDKVRKNWAAKFQSVDVLQNSSSETTIPPLVDNKSDKADTLEKGWALKKHSGSTRFSPAVKDYLTTRFMIGEKTGRKADPAEVETDMRNSRDSSNQRRFKRDEWLTKTQIKSFFSRLAASRRKNLAGFSIDQEEDVECLIEDSERNGLIDAINDEIGLKHPITYDAFDLCQLHAEDKLNTFNVAMLKNICSELEIPFKSKDRKSDLIGKLAATISQCECSQV